jgi:hypothetical protein
MTQLSINRLIKEAKNLVVTEAAAAREQGNRLAKVAWELRSDYVRRLTRDFNTIGADQAPRTVFISYSKRSGEEYFSFMQELLRKADFSVVTGFQPHDGDQDKPLKRVRLALDRSSLYLAILTKEWQVNMPNEEAQWAPSVWTVEEKGMALALEKPVVLMIEKGIHDDFWRKTTPDRVHHVFSANDYREVAESVRDALLDRYKDLMLKDVGVT